MGKHSRRYLENKQKIDSQNTYPLADATALVKEMANAKFDETIEMHFRLGIDPRHSDQQVRSTVMLPHGTGKSVRVVVFAEGEDARAAEEAGADLIGDDSLIERIQKEGFLEFDAALAVPSVMKKIGRIARILGPRGLMPNPKAGTVVKPEELPRAVEELKAGRVEFRNDKTGNLHIPIGKASFDVNSITENARAVYDAVMSQKPSATKGTYIRRMTITSSMGPSVHIDLSAIHGEEEEPAAAD